MKAKQLLFSLAFCAVSISSMAQAGPYIDDVLLLSDSSLLRGHIALNYGDSGVLFMKLDESLQFIDRDDILSISREPRTFGPNLEKIAKDLLTPPPPPKPPKVRREYSFKQKGYFFNGQVLTGYSLFGFRIVQGHKFGQFGYLGAGFGIEGVARNQRLISSSPLVLGNYHGWFLPLYIYHRGDFTKKQSAPFYFTELGYNVALPTVGIYNELYREGGFHGTVGFGVKMGSRRRFHLDLAAFFNVRQVKYEGYILALDIENEEVYRPEYMNFLYLPGLRVGFGF